MVSDVGIGQGRWGSQNAKVVGGIRTHLPFGNGGRRVFSKISGHQIIPACQVHPFKGRPVTRLDATPGSRPSMNPKPVCVMSRTTKRSQGVVVTRGSPPRQRQATRRQAEGKVERIFLFLTIGHQPRTMGDLGMTEVGCGEGSSRSTRPGRRKIPSRREAPRDAL